MLHILILLFGTAVGSFLNVVILRLNSGMSFVKGGSRCFSCQKPLKWHELIPIFSFLAQKRKCRGCGSKISWQYPAIEITTGLLFLLIFLKFDSWLLAIGYWLITSLLVVIAVYDIRHFIIPNKIVWLFNLVAFLGIFYKGPSFVGSILAGVLFFAFFAILWAVSRGKWMGFGDAKLALGLGWFLGPINTISAFLFSFWLGAIWGLILMVIFRDKYSIKSKIPFAPFLILGSLLAFFLDINLLTLFQL
ncbi:prepilin peptidase [Patescibacteria group bacterium]